MAKIKINWQFLSVFLGGLVFPAVGLGLIYYQANNGGIRKFDPEAINKFKSNAHFQYELEDYSGTFWQDLFQMLLNLLNRIIPNVNPKVGINGIEIIIYLIIIVAISLLVYSIFKDGINSIVYRKKVIPSINMEEILTEVDTVDLLDLINKSKEAGNYKTAIRLWYIFVVKNLNINSLIVWEKDKTNAQYLRELEGKSIKGEFKRITQIYEYVWFGDFVVDNKRFTEIENTFQHFSSNISKIK